MAVTNCARECMFSALEVYFTCMGVPSSRQVERGPEVKKTINPHLMNKEARRKRLRSRKCKKERASRLAFCGFRCAYVPFVLRF